MLVMLQDSRRVSDVQRQQSVVAYIRVRFNLPDRVVFSRFAGVVADVRTATDFSDRLTRSGIVPTTVSRRRDPFRPPPSRRVTRLVRARYGSEFSLLLEAVPSVGGSVFLAWLLTFARDLPGKLRRSLEEGRQAALATRRGEIELSLEEAAAQRYIATKELQLEIARKLYEELTREVARDELGNAERLIRDDLIQALFRLSAVISDVEQVDRSELAE